MKIVSLYFLILIAVTSSVKAQDQVINGNLSVGGEHNALGYGKGLYFNGNTDNFWFNRFNTADNKSEFRLNISDDIGPDDKFVIGTVSSIDQHWYPHTAVLGNGNVGIGTVSPDFKLDTWGSGRFYNSEGRCSSILSDGDAAFALPNGGGKGSNGAPFDKYPLRMYESYGWNFTLQNIVNNPGDGAYSGFRIQTANAALWNEGILFQVRADGNVGIGVARPTDKLAVNGNIRAREIRVEAGNWPDYVFTADHQKPSLAELETFIKANRHLPDVPSAEQVAREGVDLGEVSSTLLKKIEEMTLYLIEIKKENEELRARLTKLEEVSR